MIGNYIIDQHYVFLFYKVLKINQILSGCETRTKRTLGPGDRVGELEVRAAWHCSTEGRWQLEVPVMSAMTNKAGGDKFLLMSHK
jgi:hypothetical protein